MDNKRQKLEEQPLNPEEERELNEGQVLYEMTRSAGWKVIERMLTDMAFHSWVDPRETEDKEQWMWRELNAFHAANVAKELISAVQAAVARADYLAKIKNGELPRRSMRI